MKGKEEVSEEALGTVGWPSDGGSVGGPEDFGQGKNPARHSARVLSALTRSG